MLRQPSFLPSCVSQTSRCAPVVSQDIPTCNYLSPQPQHDLGEQATFHRASINFLACELYLRLDPINHIYISSALLDSRNSTPPGDNRRRRQMRAHTHTQRVFCISRIVLGDSKLNNLTLISYSSDFNFKNVTNFQRQET